MGNVKVPVKQFNSNVSTFINVTDAQNISLDVRYIKSATFPVTDSDSFIYGNQSISFSDVADNLLCCKAAKTLGIKRGVINPALEQRHSELLERLKSCSSAPRFYSMPLMGTSGLKSFYQFYMKDNTTLQLSLTEGYRLYSGW